MAPILLGAALAACEQESQLLPFSVDSRDATVRTVQRTDSVTVSTPAGAAVQFPTQSVPASTSVSIAPASTPAAVQQSGTVASGTFRLEPAGLVLDRPAAAELKFTPPARADAWLASVVNVTPRGVHELGGTRLDLRSGLAEARIRQLGTLTVVVPDPRAVVRVRRGGVARSLAASGAPLAATGTDSLKVNCGDPDNRCAGLSATASQNLLSMVEDAAAIYPRISGTLRIDGSAATGEVTLSTTIRVLLKSGASAENVEFVGLLRPTATTVVTEDASKITMTNVYFRISGSAGSESRAHELTRTLQIPKGESNGSVTIDRTFQLRNEAGQLEDATVSVTFPTQFYQ